MRGLQHGFLQNAGTLLSAGKGLSSGNDDLKKWAAHTNALSKSQSKRGKALGVRDDGTGLWAAA